MYSFLQFSRHNPFPLPPTDVSLTAYNSRGSAVPSGTSSTFGLVVEGTVNSRSVIEIANRARDGSVARNGGAEVLPEIFDAFVTVEQGIITQHGGTITASNRKEGGATLEVWLPAAPSV